MTQLNSGSLHSYNINHIESLGISISCYDDEMILKMGKKSLKSAIWSIVFGFFSLFVLLGAILFWVRLFTGIELELTSFISGIISSFVGGYGIVLFTKGIDRLFKYLSFNLIIRKDKVELQNSIRGKETSVFSNNVFFKLIMDDVEKEKVSMVIQDGENEVKIHSFIGVNKEYKTSLEKLIKQINQYI